MIVQLLTSFTGALGFCLVFHLRRRYMFAASLGGLLTCGVYLAAASIWSGILLPTLTAAAFAALYAEFLAWFMGAPATLFLIPALLISLGYGESAAVHGFVATLALIAVLAVPLYFLGGSFMALATVGVAGFFSLIFIILYAVNLKYMH